MLRRFLVFLFILSLLLPVVFPDAARAQDSDPGWRVESVRALDEVVDDLTIPTRLYLAPDGRHIAYEDRADDRVGVCVIDVSDVTPRCVYMPRETNYRFPYNDLYPALKWSLDSEQIALIGMPFHFFEDTDLGLVDLTTPEPTFIQVIDDGYTGDLIKLPEGASIEANPVFSPDGSQIALEQAVSMSDRVVTHISRIDLATGEPTSITRLPGYGDYDRDFGTVMSLDWSPDGSTLAFALRHAGEFNPAYDGVWLVDVASGDLTHLVSRDTILPLYQTIYPDANETAINIIAPARWSSDGSRLLFWAGAPFLQIGQVWAFWLDVDSGDIHPVPLPETGLDTGALRGLWPHQAAWSPDGRTLLISARAVVPPDDAETHMLIESDERPFTALYLIDVATGEDILLGYLPQGIGQIFYAYWGPDNDVFAGGYYLKLGHVR